jgi:DNA-binding NarL/FixJ family response regulator
MTLIGDGHQLDWKGEPKMASVAPITASTVAATPTPETVATPKVTQPSAHATQQEPTAAATQQAAAPQDTVTISSTSALPSTAEPISSQVLLLSAQGESIQEIAQQLEMSPQAVKSYLG